MKDKNGREIRTGDIVRVTGAYFKNDNGLFFVENSPGDCNWCGSDHSLNKIGKTGKISTAKYRVGFWPIGCCVNDRDKAAAARKWNKEHAEIEVVDGVNTDEVREHFIEKAEEREDYAEREKWRLGDDSPIIAQYRQSAAHYRAVAQYIEQKEGV